MNVVVLYGSPHEHGNTDELVRQVLAGLDGRVRIVRINAYERRIRPCIGCGGCVKIFSCTKYRDMDDIILSLKEADLILIAFPLYFTSVPAPLKALIDRLQPVYCETYGRDVKPEKSKQALALVTSGNESGYSVSDDKLMKYVSNLFGADLLGAACAERMDDLGKKERIEIAAISALALINA